MKLFISNSGGRTSMKMTWDILNTPSYRERFEEIRIGFANTSKERLETLDFIHRCDREWNLGIVWVEAEVQERGEACTHRIVAYETAKRNGEVFEAVIAKYGIPNKAYPHCTRELKANPIRSLIQSWGWQEGEYVMAIGIRADEPQRLTPKPNVVYPLATDFPTTKWMVNEWWEEQPFQLELMEHEGNCDNCWKKSERKLIRRVHEDRESFAWWAEMERKYGLAGHNVDGTPRTFWRENRRTEQLVQIADVVGQQRYNYSLFSDEGAGCSESCEAF